MNSVSNVKSDPPGSGANTTRNVIVTDLDLSNDKKIATLPAFGFIANGVEAIEWLNAQTKIAQHRGEFSEEAKAKVLGKMVVGVSNVFQGFENVIKILLLAPSNKSAWDDHQKDYRNNQGKIGQHNVTVGLTFILDKYPELVANYCMFAGQSDEAKARNEILNVCKGLSENFLKSRYLGLNADPSLSLFDPKAIKLLALSFAITFNTLKPSAAAHVLGLLEKSVSNGVQKQL